MDEDDSSSSSESDYDSDDSYDRFTMASNFTTPPTTPSTSSDSASQDQVYPSAATDDSSLPSPPLSHKTPLASFHCRYLHHRRCTLFLTPYGLRLCTGTGVAAADQGKEIFHRPWSDLFELSKVASTAKARKELDLKFLGEDMAKSGKADMGEDKTMEKHLDVVRLGHFAGRRDEVFNSIIGFSGVRWQWKS